MTANGLSERLQTPISTAELQRRWGLVRQAMEREKIDVLLMQNNNDHMGGAVKWFTDMPACNGYPSHGGVPARRRDDRRDAGPVQRRQPPAGRHVARRQAHAHHAELRVGALHQFLRSGTGREGARALRQRDDRLRLHLSDVVRARRLHHEEVSQGALRRRDRDGRPHQGDQERRGAGTRQARRADAGRRDEGGVRRHQARHARPRRGGDRAVLQPAQRLGERHLSLRLDAARHRGEVRPAPRAEPRHPEGRRRRACWSRTAVPAACTPSLAAPAWSAPRCRRR